MSKTYVFDVDNAGDRAAGLQAYTERVAVTLDSGEPMGQPGEFEQHLRDSLADWFDGASVTLASEVNSERDPDRTNSPPEQRAGTGTVAAGWELWRIFLALAICVPLALGLVLAFCYWIADGSTREVATAQFISTVTEYQANWLVSIAVLLMAATALKRPVIGPTRVFARSAKALVVAGTVGMWMSTSDSHGLQMTISVVFFAMGLALIMVVGAFDCLLMLKANGNQKAHS